MPKLSQSRVLRDAYTITSTPILGFLAPAFYRRTAATEQRRHGSRGSRAHATDVEECFYHALNQVALCRQHKQIDYNATRRQPRRGHTSLASQPAAEATNHQRFDSKGRLIIETTAERHPAFTYDQDVGDANFFDKNEQHFAASTKLPPSFFSDVSFFRRLTPKEDRKLKTKEPGVTPANEMRHQANTVEDQLQLLKSVRHLEEQLVKAKDDLKKSLATQEVAKAPVVSKTNAILTKQHYLNLVDLYFYSHNSRFSPESPDQSPNPIILDDYSFTLSADFSRSPSSIPEQEEEHIDESYVSPLKEIEEHLKNNQLREIAAMQVFVDLLVDDTTSNRSLFEAYKELPEPGVAYLPKGVIRLLLQRMSTPWVRTPASMLRYLSLMDDMQAAKLPISVSEWSSAIFLTGRCHSRIDHGEVGRAFNLWRQMENDAGVKSSNVTFNILFDVAVRSGKFALGETILKEMHKRNLRLNRLGRISLMFYHGLRGDGDGVRKAYHDFVEAGEIVDTLVLNCVIASLINAQEPTAADQIYQRMRSLQVTLARGRTEDGHEALFKLHPDIGSNRLGNQMARNELGRLLLRSANLKETLPDHHEELQASMPLTPNFTTFRTMLAYHCTVSGDLDRATVLLSEMLEDYDIPLFSSVFQLLFKGFAIHGVKSGPNSSWSKKRLEMVWTACRLAIKDANQMSDQEMTDDQALPSVKDVNLGMASIDHAAGRSTSRSSTLSMWEQLVIDLAAFPRERLRRLQRYHSEQFDEGVPASNFHSPFFQQAHYSAPQPDLDDEEGEYTLPDPIRSTLVNPNYHKKDPYSDEDEDGLIHFATMSDEAQLEDQDGLPTSVAEASARQSFSSMNEPTSIAEAREQYRLKATKPLVCWLLRAYSRMTGSRTQVEKVWHQISKIWHPKDEVQRQIVLRVLLRCLKDCDRYSGHGSRTDAMGSYT